MIKNIIFSFCLLILISTNSFSAGSNDTTTTKVKSDYTKAVDLIKFAKKYEKKGNLDKAKKKKPLQADTLNYLGFTTRKLGDYENGEKYYLLGLEINPNHVGINEYLGELYVATDRIDLAKERLKILEKCKCEEYNELKEIIAGTKKSKY